jgi:hypothetical protein
MKPRMNGSWILAGVAAFAVVLASEHEAHAKGGIIVTTGTTQQTGDPTYEYIFTVDLLPNSTLLNGGFFTIYDLPALTASALTSQPNISWGSSVQLLGNTPSGTIVTDDPTIYNVTWQWNGMTSITNPDSTDLFLGTFIVGSTTELTSPPSGTLVYVGSLDGSTASNQGTVTLSPAVPEPSSVILLLAGIGMLPMLWVPRRQRR